MLFDRSGILYTLNAMLIQVIIHYLIEKRRPCNIIPLFYCVEGGKVYAICNLGRNQFYWLVVSQKEYMVSISQSK